MRKKSTIMLERQIYSMVLTTMHLCGLKTNGLSTKQVFLVRKVQEWVKTSLPFSSFKSWYRQIAKLDIGHRFKIKNKIMKITITTNVLEDEIYPILWIPPYKHLQNCPDKKQNEQEKISLLIIFPILKQNPKNNTPQNEFQFHNLCRDT